ncbi:MAG TPA: SDR family oxidoreductase, partial [bacterium]|nr:SDR family oxidoreductase [bacterium]
RVNAVSPGVISFPAHYGPAKRRRLAAKAALKRGGDPQDIARAVLFLAREPFLTGQVLRVDGGRFL